MRARLLSLPLLVLSFVVWAASSPTSFSQGRGGFGGGGGKGSFGGFGKAGDPNAMFDRLAKGRGYFLINEMWMMKKPLQDYAQEKGITNGQITREQYIAFDQQVKANFQGGSVNFKGGPGGGIGAPGGFPQGTFAPGGFPPGNGSGAFARPGGGNPAEAMDQFAESEFKRRDLNLDNLLNTDEMPRNLKDELERWDVGKDGTIDLPEYKAFFRSRLGVGGEGNPAAPANPVTILIEEDLLEKRPEVFRAGKLPKNIPSWFTQLDSDNDGQVGLYEWRKGGKAMEEFRTWDRNDDGLITPDEAIHQSSLQSAAIAKDRPTVSSTNGAGGGNGDDRRKGTGFSFFSKKKPQ